MLRESLKLCGVILIIVLTGQAKASLPDSLQQKVDSLYALLPNSPDSLLPSLINQSASIYQKQYSDGKTSYYESGWPIENINLLKKADTLAGQWADSTQWIKSLAYLTNYYYEGPDTTIKLDYFKRYKRLRAEIGYYLVDNPRPDLNEDAYQYFRISNSILIFEDTSQQLDIETILSPSYQAAFKINPFRLQDHLPVRDKVYWAKIRLLGQTNRDDDYFFMLGFEIYSWRDIEIYIPDSSGVYQKQKSGFFTPLEEKALPDWRNYFSVFVAKGKEKTIYFRLANPTSIATPSDIFLYRTNREEIKAKEAQTDHINGVFQGVVLIQGLFFLFWFFSTRSRMYLYYVLYLLSLSLFTLIANYFRSIFPAYPDMTGPFFSIAAFCTSLGFVLFSFTLLRVAERQNGKLWRKLLWGGLGLMFVTLLVNLYASIYQYEVGLSDGAYARLEFNSVRVGMVILLLFFIASAYWAVQAIRNGQRNAIYFLLANSVFILGVGIPMLSPILDVDWFSFNEAIYSIQISIIVQLALFGLAVGQQQNQLEKEKRLALEDKLGLQKNINEATAKFVPYEFLRSLGRESILDVKLGDQVEKSVTVLFMDIRSYTTLSERMTPQENFAFLNSYLGRMGPIIKRNGGFVNQYYGDGIMAIFMGPAQDAWDTTAAIQATLISYNQQRIDHQRLPIKVGMGLHSGFLMMGVIGDAERMDAGVVSDTVNTASRMEGLSKIFGAELILSETTYHALEEEAQQHCRSLGHVQVKGRNSSIGIYEGALTSESLKITQKQDFEKALRHYQEGEILTAIQMWEKLLTLNPNDKAISFYLQECRIAQQNSPSTNWDPVLRLDRK